MKRLFYFLLILSCLLPFQSCKKGCTDPKAINFQENVKENNEKCLYPIFPLEVNFKLLFNSYPVEFDEFYPNNGNKNISIEKLKFYVSDFTLINENGSEILINDVLLADFNQADTVFKPEFTAFIPYGNYSGVKFGLGLKPSLNNLDPANFEPNNPLSVYSGMYWTWATKYIFFSVEGRLDSDNNKVADGNYFYHLGFEKYYKQVGPLAINLQHEYGKEPKLTVSLDFYEALYKKGTVVDPFVNGASHTSGSEELANQLLTNISQVFKAE